MDNTKIDPSILGIPQLENTEATWEVIVSYNGNLKVVEDPLNATVEILNNSFAIVTLPEENINKLADFSEVEYIERPKRLGLYQSESMRVSCISSVLNDQRLGLTGRGVIIAVLDSGIDYAHPEFLNEEGNTRIISLWDQTIDGNPPSGFSIGNVYSQQEINAAISIGNINERRAALPSEDTLGHGTGVASVAAGNTVGAAPGASLLIVKIGRTIDKGFATTTELMRGVAYASNTALSLGLPIVINISFGTNDGPHDGFSLFERYIDDVANSGKTNIVVATGNEGDTGKHFSSTLVQGQTIDMEFSVADNLPNVTINLWKNFIDFFTFEVISPSGVSSGTIRFSNEVRRYIFSNCTLYLSFGQPNFLNPAQEVYFMFQANSAEYVTPGIWTVRIFGETIVYGRFNAWLPVSEISGRTYFLDPTIDTTLTMPSTSFAPIGVGAYNSLLDTAASFSGRGYTRVFETVKPDIVAPGVSINTALAGGGYTSQTGTSFATPHVTGAVAILMQWGIVQSRDPFLYGQKAKAYLRLGARRFSTMSYPNRQWGYGALCLSATINYLTQMDSNQMISVNKIAPNLVTNQNLSSDLTTNNNLGYLSNENTSLNNDSTDNIKASQMNQEITNTLEENNVTSQDYIDLVVRVNSYVGDFAAKNNDVYLQPLLTEYGILSMPQDRESTFNKTEGANIIQEQPKCMGLMGRESLEASGITTVQNQPYLNLRGSGTIVGIIDTGIDYTNSSFVYEDNTTKIEYIWDQSINGNPPTGFLFGTEYSNVEINNALANENPRSIVPHTDEDGHGTFLASIAAGREELGTNKIGAAPDATLIVVKLKQAKNYLKRYSGISGNIKNVYSSADLMQAMEYIRNKSIELGAPLSLCISLGTNEGGHDGLSLFEEYVSRLSIRNGVIISCAMGNEGRARRHISTQLKETGDYKDIEIRVSENEEGFAVYIFATEPDKLSVAITSPTGEFVNAVPVRDGGFFETSLLFEKSLVGVSYVFASEKNTTENIFVRILSPTPGLWTIRIKGDMIINGLVHAWLPISNFLSPETYFLESVADYTMTIPATADGTLSVGAYNSTSDILYVSTGRGPTRLNLQNPSIVAPGVDVLGANGTMSGTSVATAICVGACALLLEWAIVQKNEPIFNTTRAKAYLISGATRRQSLDYPNYQWGYGTLNLVTAFGALRIL